MADSWFPLVSLSLVHQKLDLFLIGQFLQGCSIRNSLIPPLPVLLNQQRPIVLLISERGVEFWWLLRV